MPLLSIDGLEKRFVQSPDLIARGLAKIGIGQANDVTVHAIDGVSLDINQGEVLGLIGESGCGKSTLARIVAGILPASGGSVTVDGANILSRKDEAARMAGLDVQMIFQDPFASMNPRYRIRDIIAEAPVYHGRMAAKEADQKVAEYLESVSLSPDYAERFPHQFSGGQRQRIVIARALAMRPKLIIADEAVAALDVSIQAQIINLFLDLKERFGLTYLFISHDLSVVRHVSDRVAIMYLGRIVETAPARTIFANPLHPYTQALMDQKPSIKNRRKLHNPISGEVPSPINPPSGCHFHPRCPKAFDRCKVDSPALRTMADGQKVACHLYDQPTLTVSKKTGADIRP